MIFRRNDYQSWKNPLFFFYVTRCDYCMNCYQAFGVEYAKGEIPFQPPAQGCKWNNTRSVAELSIVEVCFQNLLTSKHGKQPCRLARAVEHRPLPSKVHVRSVFHCTGKRAASTNITACEKAPSRLSNLIRRCCLSGIDKFLESKKFQFTYLYYMSSAAIFSRKICHPSKPLVSAYYRLGLYFR